MTEPVKRIRPRCGRLCLALVSLAVGWLLCEAILAIAWTNPYRNESPDHVLKLKIHHPLTDQWIDRSLIYGSVPPARFRTDSRSYILPSFQHEDADLTVTFLGASTTENVTVDEDRRFHAVVARNLGEEGLRVNALNAARAGNTLHDSINVLLNHAVLDDPDIVALMHAANDTGVLKRDPSYRSRMGHVAGLSDAVRWSLQVASRRSSVFGLLRGVARGENAAREDSAFRSPDEARRAVPVEPFERRLRLFVRACRSLEIEPVLMTQPLASSHTELTPEWANELSQNVFNAAVRRVAEQEQVELIDLVAYLLAEVDDWNEPMRVFFDGMHVTDDGSQELATHISARLREIAERRQILQKSR